MADIIVNAGGNLQTALNAAVPGDRILLEAGATFTGNFTFPAKSGVVTLTSNSVLPARRIAPGDSALLATLTSAVPDYILKLSGSANWLIDGLIFAPVGYTAVAFFLGASNIKFKRILSNVSGDVQQNRRCIGGGGTNIDVLDSYIDGYWQAGSDSQAIWFYEGAGPYLIHNNHLSAASENVMFGGADNASAATNPANITITDNFFTKREVWRTLPRNVKNLLEFKNATNVLVEGNTFEKCWADGQDGTAFLITPVNQEGTAPWSVTKNITFKNNKMTDVVSAVSVTGYAGEATYKPTQQTSGIIIENNLFVVTTDEWIQPSGEVLDLTLNHNTVIVSGTPNRQNIRVLKEGIISHPVDGQRAPAYAVGTLTIKNNALHGPAGSVWSSFGSGQTALNNTCPSWSMEKNVLGTTDSAGLYLNGVNAIITPAALLAELDAGNNYIVEAGSIYEDYATDGYPAGWVGFDGLDPSSGESPPSTFWARSGAATGTDNDLDRTGDGGGAYDAIGVTTDAMISDGEFTVTVPVIPTGNGFNVGLDAPTGAVRLNVRYGVGIGNGFVTWLENGAYAGETAVTGPIELSFRVSENGTVVKGYINDVERHTFDNLIGSVFPLKGWVWMDEATGHETTDGFLSGVAVLPPPSNEAPTVNAGVDVSVVVGQTVTLQGTATDPDDDPLTYAWSKFSGVGTLTFGSPSAAQTTVSPNTVGVFVVQLAVSDGEVTVFDYLTLTGTPDPATLPPPVDVPEVTAPYTVRATARTHTVAFTRAERKAGTVEQVPSPRDVGEISDLVCDWSGLLNGAEIEEILEVSSVSPGFIALSSSHDLTTTTHRITGGVLNQQLVIKIIIETDEGLILVARVSWDCREIVLTVTDPRDPEEVSPVDCDWSDVLGDAEITVAAVEIVPAGARVPIAENADFRHVGTSTTQHWLSGGTPGGNPAIKVSLTDDTGRKWIHKVVCPVSQL